MRWGWIALGLCLTLTSGGPVAAAGGQEDFKPELLQVVDAVAEQYEPKLLAAGPPAGRVERARGLLQGLEPIAELDPLQQHEALMAWLAAGVMLESAVADTGAPPPAWTEELLAIYRALARKEPYFRGLRGKLRLMAAQSGQDSQALLDHGRQLIALSAYSRSAVRWLANRRPLDERAAGLRRALLEAQVAADRRDGRFQSMLQAARRLQTLDDPPPAAAAWEAEAAFELGQRKAGRRALKRARGRAPAAAVEGAEKRARLAAAGPDAAVAQARALMALDEPWRLRRRWRPEQVVDLADPALDALYIEALLDDGLDFRSAWAFGRLARGEPTRPAFLARRVGAGMAVLLAELRGGEAQPAAIQRLRSRLLADLDALDPSHPRLARLTRLTLPFTSLLAGGDIDAVARQLAQPVAEFVAAHPADRAGMRMAFAIGRLVPEAPTPWQVVQRHRRALAAKAGKKPAAGLPLPEELIPAAAWAAISRAVDGGGGEALSAVQAAIEVRSDLDDRPALMLWRAHLLAVRGLLAAEPARVRLLQRAGQAYGRVIEAWSNTAADRRHPQPLCNAAASLAALMLHSQSPDDAHGLLANVGSVCRQLPTTAAVAAVVELAQGKPPAGEGPTAAELLAELAPRLPSQAARMQAWLWLARSAEAESDAAAAAAHYQRAAGELAAERRRGHPLVLAPDLRAFVALVGQINLGLEYRTDHPLGFEIPVVLDLRLVLFPPAAVDAARLAAETGAEKSD